MRATIKKMIPAACMILGIGLLAYPTVNDRYESYLQQKILAQWESNLLLLDRTEPETGPAPDVSAAPVPEERLLSGAPLMPLRAEQPAAPIPVQTPVADENVEGVLVIDKINLKLPILKGATAKNMKISVASIENTGRPGAVGNYAIAGHRNLTYGKNFNRLDEVEAGDIVEVDAGGRNYRYKVEEKLYVLPKEVWVLKGNGKDREITLITCHPMENPTHRIAVKGKLIEDGK
ncbi:class D sortase [Paenibacillus hamazuiensis]|uniref:class D sortase n=1 Tax=Paenibacillus hamazuiensis TaxID=2936508 RepID=UPI00200BBA30|nr:class D sortase [Paenibacillus hamazuiensis]